MDLFELCMIVKSQHLVEDFWASRWVFVWLLSLPAMAMAIWVAERKRL